MLCQFQSVRVCVCVGSGGLASCHNIPESNRSPMPATPHEERQWHSYCPVCVSKCVYVAQTTGVSMMHRHTHTQWQQDHTSKEWQHFLSPIVQLLPWCVWLFEKACYRVVCVCLCVLFTCDGGALLGHPMLSSQVVANRLNFRLPLVKAVSMKQT